MASDHRPDPPLSCEKILMYSPIAMLVLDTFGHIISANQAAQRMFNYSDSDMRGMALYVLQAHSEDQSENCQALLQLLRTIHIDQLETLFEANGGIQFPATLCSAYDPESDAIVLQVMNQSSSKMDQSRYIQQKIAADQRTKAKSEFISVMSHEIRTPLHGIINSLTLLADRVDDGEALRLCEIARFSSTSLVRIVDDILDQSKLENDKVELLNQDFSLYALIESTVNLFRSAVDNSGDQLCVTIEDPVPDIICADEGRVRQILSNYISNAIKFSHQSRIDLRVSYQPGGLLRFEVVDAGIGMSAELLGRLFGMFEQADSGISREYGGTGLGLAICKLLAELMGGEVGVESAPGQGARVWFEFTPELGKGAGEREGEPLARVAEASGPAKPSLHGRILMVDDSEVNRELFGFMMEGQTLDIDYAHNGQQAYERVQSQRYDLVLMDLQMPVMDGFQSAALIRDYYQEQKLPQLPILALTAEVEKTAAKQCLDAGMKGCITKPIVYEKLLAHIRPWLERPCDQSEQDELSEASENAASGESESPLLGTDQPLLDSAFLDRQRQHIRPQAFVLMVNVYIEETQQRLEALGALFSTTISAEQMDAIAAQAHVLKSSAASFGALRMADLAIRLEAQAKSETKLDPLLLTALQLCFAELGTQLKAMC